MKRIQKIIIGIVMISLPSMAIAKEDTHKNLAVEPKADALFQQMSNLLAKTKTFSVTADKITDFVMESGQKIQISEVTHVFVSRPNMIHGQTVGDLHDEQLWYDGKTVSVYDSDQNTYGVVKAPGTIDAMMDFIVEKYGASLPMADLVFSDPYQSAMEKVRMGQYIGLHYVGKVRCHHLAFRQAGLDWQIWIEDGPRPLPRKLVITYKELPGHPQFIAHLNDWNLAPKLTKEFFEFKPPANAKKIEIQPMATKEPQAVNAPAK